jgi:hypothetical protein
MLKNNMLNEEAKKRGKGDAPSSDAYVVTTSMITMEPRQISAWQKPEIQEEIKVKTETRNQLLLL